MTQEPGKWSIVLVRHDNEGEPFFCHYVNDGYYWWSVSSDGVGYSWEQLIAEDAHLQVIQVGTEACMVFECGKPQATLGPCQEHLDQSIAEDERRPLAQVEVEAAVSVVRAEAADDRAWVEGERDQWILTAEEQATELAREEARAARAEALVDRVKALWDAWENGLVADESLGSELRTAFSEADATLVAPSGAAELRAELATVRANRDWWQGIAKSLQQTLDQTVHGPDLHCENLHRCQCSSARAYRTALTGNVIRPRG